MNLFSKNVFLNLVMSVNFFQNYFVNVKRLMPTNVNFCTLPNGNNETWKVNKKLLVFRIDRG